MRLTGGQREVLEYNGYSENRMGAWRSPRTGLNLSPGDALRELEGSETYAQTAARMARSARKDTSE